MWVYWKRDVHLTTLVLNKYGAADRTLSGHGSVIAYNTKRNAIYSVKERPDSDLPTVTTLKEIDEIRLMYSLGLTDPEIRTIMESTHVD